MDNLFHSPCLHTLCHLCILELVLYGWEILKHTKKKPRVNPGAHSARQLWCRLRQGRLHTKQTPPTPHTHLPSTKPLTPQKTFKVSPTTCWDPSMDAADAQISWSDFLFLFVRLSLWRSYLLHLVQPSIHSHPPTHGALPQPRATGLDHSRSREVRKIMQTSLMWTWPILKPYRGLQTWLLFYHTGLLPAFAYMTAHQHT